MTTPVSLEDVVRGARELAARAVEPSAGSVATLTHINPTGVRASMIGSVTNDSRTVEPDSMYCAVRGLTVDGHDFASDAVAAGASALLVDHQLPELNVPQLIVDDVRQAMPWLAASRAGDPSVTVPVIGVTGTNGKTTTTHFLRDIAGASDDQTYVIGTLDGLHTTPEAPVLQSLLASAATTHDLVAIEVSSHALDQHRTDATRFRVAVFTNLSQDHLDYHGDMETYFAAKAQLFDGRAEVAVVNVDDPYGARLAADMGARGLDVVSVTPSAHELQRLDDQGSAFSWRGRIVELAIPGRFNVTNALLAAETAVLLGHDPDRVVAGLASVTRVPGRMDRVPGLPAGSPAVFVDYSHTPDSLERAVATALELTTGRVIVVFGCGGDRDREKRPLMGRAALRADIGIVTSDNPRSEDPSAIVADVLAGIDDADRDTLQVEIDRRVAIGAALSMSQADDVVVIAGKGHETTQTFADRVEPFDDRQVVLDHYSDSAA